MRINKELIKVGGAGIGDLTDVYEVRDRKKS